MKLTYVSHIYSDKLLLIMYSYWFSDWNFLYALSNQIDKSRSTGQMDGRMDAQSTCCEQSMKRVSVI